MIAHQTFIVQNNNKFLDFDNKYGAQCVDLARFYWQEVLGIKQPKGVNGAKDFWANYATDPNLYTVFDRIPNTPEFVPLSGDTMIWKHGLYGHIAIVASDNNTTAKFYAFSQNDPTGAPCTVVQYSYTNCYGVFRLKESLMPEMYGTPNQYDLTNKESMKVAVDHLNLIQTGQYIRIDKVEESVKKATAAGFEKGYAAGRDSVSLLEEPPKVLKFKDGSEWERNGIQYQTGPLVGNYDKKKA